ncbi:MAG: hypothetical protein Q8J89_12505 [Caulobacter sp.]|nr:hypothetical protein [Caulobacter sp.]
MQLLDPHSPSSRRFGLFQIRRPQAPPFGRRPAEKRPDRFFLHVRSVSADGFAHLFQFALVDDDGEAAVSVFVCGRSPVRDAIVPAVGDAPPPIPAITWDQLDTALEPCGNASIIAFGRTLHGSFLPAATRGAIAGLDCARARFERAARRVGIRVRPGDVGDLNDARQLIGLPPVRSPDAALKAMGLRELWTWMDGVEAEV